MPPFPYVSVKPSSGADSLPSPATIACTKDFREAPIRTGRRNRRSRSSSARIWKFWRRVLPKPNPGSMTSCERRTPQSSAWRTDRARPRLSERQIKRANGPCCMVSGRPRRCIRTRAVRWRRATSATRASKRSPLTSLMMPAPARIACSATSAFVVSTEMAAGRRSFRSFEDNPRITGRTRPSSSSAGMGFDPGRVDSPPTSIQSAP